MGITRRQFLAISAAVAGSGGILTTLLRRRAPDGTRVLLADTGGDLCSIALDGSAPAYASSRLRFGHGFAPMPGGRALVLDKGGPHAVLVDVAGCRILRDLDAGAGRRFYGHGAYSTGRRQLLTVESEYDTATGGRLVARDPDTLEAKAELPTHGREPHDLLVFEDHGVYAICNAHSGSGGRSTVAICSLADGRLLAEAISPADDIAFGHVARDGDGVVVSTQRFRWPDAAQKKALELRAAHAPDEERKELQKKIADLREALPSPTFRVSLKGEVTPLDPAGEAARSLAGFSIAATDRAVAVTHGPAFAAAFYDLRSRKLIRFLELPNRSPLAVAAMPNGDFLLGAAKGLFWRVRAPDFAQLEPAFQGIPSEHALFWAGAPG